MRILIVNKFLYPNGGSETYIFKIGQQLTAMGHEVQYFGMEHEGRIVGNAANIYTQSMDFHGGSPLSKAVYPFRILYSREAKADIKRVLSAFHADVVHLNNINFQLTPSVIDGIREFDPAIRIVYTAHDAQWVCPNHLLRIPSTGEVCTRCIDGAVNNCMKYRCIHNSRFRSALGMLEARLYQRRRTYEQVDRIVCPSQFLNDILSHNPQLAGRTVTMHNFVDMENLASPAGSANAAENVNAATGNVNAVAENVNAATGNVNAAAGNADATAGKLMAAENGTGEGVPYVLYFGRYTREKGVATLLEAAGKLTEIPFVFAGKGELEETVNAASNVHSAGFLGSEELQMWIRKAAFVVFPSEWLENGPFAVIESIMNGTPVLASNLGGTPEMIAEGETGELFEAGNAGQLAERIRTLYADGERLERYRENCRKTAEGKGSIHFDTLAEYCDRLVREIYA